MEGDFPWPSCSSACRIFTSSGLNDLSEGSWSYGDIGPRREVGEDEAFNKNKSILKQSTRGKVGKTYHEHPLPIHPARRHKITNRRREPRPMHMPRPPRLIDGREADEKLDFIL